MGRFGCKLMMISTGLIIFGVLGIRGTVEASLPPEEFGAKAVLIAETERLGRSLVQLTVLTGGTLDKESSEVEVASITKPWEMYPGRSEQNRGTDSLSANVEPLVQTLAASPQNGHAKADVPKPGHRLQLISHIAVSHVGVLTRPVTALKRLFFYAYDTVKDAVPAAWRSKLKPVPEVEGPDDEKMDLVAWEKRLDKITGVKTSYGTLDFLVDGEEYFPKFFTSIQEAARKVSIRTYIFDNDDFAMKVADTLRNRSHEIKVKILLDGLGTIVATGVDPVSLPDTHQSPPSVRNYLENGSKIKVRQQINPWFTGDHAKTVIVDDNRAFIGGMNIGREYRYEWHDLMVDVQGPVVGELAHGFDKAWAGAGVLGDLESLAFSLRKRRENPSGSGYPVRVLQTRPGDSEIRNVQLEAIRRARNYIFIQNPYFTDDSILCELVKARQRGVDVRVVLPGGIDNGLVGRSNMLAANKMIKNGIRVYLLPGMTHVKAAIYDGWACFGSANFDKLSFRVNYEINLATSHRGAVRDLLDRLFYPDFMVSKELTENVPIKAVDYLLEIVADQL